MLPNKLKLVIAVALLAFCSLVAASAAAAAPKDNEALKLANQAIMVEYLGTQFEEAAATLRQALELCAGAKGNCSPKVEAQLHRDLGVVMITGLGQSDDGKLQFAQALQIDPSMTLDQDLATDEVKQAWEEVKAEAPAPAPSPGVPGEEVPTGQPAVGAEGDLIHQPPAEQAILTPVPLYVEVPADLATPRLKIKVRYKTFGSQRWKTLEFEKHGKGWAAEIPCEDISDVTGALKYYIQATEGGDLVAFSGSRRNPHTVMITRMLAGEPPRLPGKPPPAQCQSIGEVPDCFDDADCGEFAICEDGRCVDTGEGKVEGKLALNWVSAAFQLDLLVFPGESGVCGGGGSYTCFYSDGTQYLLQPQPNLGNQVNAGVGLATMRVMLGYDRTVYQGLRLGLRAGFAFGGGPKADGGAAFMPIHAEGRAAWWFIDKPFIIQPYAMLSGGMMQVDGKVVVTVVNPDVIPPEVPNESGYAREKRMLEAWTKKGLPFVSLGAGAMIAVAPNFGPVIEVKAGQLFGSSGTFLAASGGFAVGF